MSRESRPAAAAAAQPRGKPGRGKPGRRALAAAGLAVGMIAVTGCTNNQFTRLGWPEPVTKQGQTMLTLWQGSWIAAWAVGFVVWGIILWACIFHRKKTDELPPQVRYNLPIEMLYTIVPFILIAVLFYFTAKDENYVDKIVSHPDVIVDVTGFQWSWQFAYPQYKVPGTAAGDVTLIGQPYPGPLPELVLPEHKTIEFRLDSLDVVHSFWVPEFLFKRDVIPNHTNYFDINLTTTGTYTGHCTELCGIYHSLMLFKVKVVTPQQFYRFMAQKQAQQKAGGAR